jgi:hypothetical protein
MRSQRSVLALSLLALMVDVGAASAQQTDQVYKIVMLITGSPGLVPHPCRDGLDLVRPFVTPCGAEVTS